VTRSATQAARARVVGPAMVSAVSVVVSPAKLQLAA